MTLTSSRGITNVPSLLTPGTLARSASRGSWQWAKHLAAIDRAIVDAVEGRISKTLIIDAPPRHGKSELVSRWTPAWYLMSYPKRRVILTSYGAEYARTWGRRAREIVKEWAPIIAHKAFLSNVTSAATDWETISGGGMVTAGAGGPLTGRGSHLLVVDDPIKNDKDALSPAKRQGLWDWWQSTASTRLEPGGIAVIMATRWHKEDLSGRILMQAEKGDIPPVSLLHLPAIAEASDPLGREEGEALWPERFPIESLEIIKRRTDPFWWSALYQGKPTRSERMEWPDEYFADIFVESIPDSFDYSVIAIDPSKGKDAKKGDYASICWLGASGGRLYFEALMGRWPVKQLVESAVGMFCRFGGSAVALESNAWQDLLAPEFDRVCSERGIPPLPIRLVHNSIAKEVRIRRLGTYLSRGMIRTRPQQSNRMLVEQMKQFPNGEHDDGPDSLEMAIRIMQEEVRAHHAEARGSDDDYGVEVIG